MRLAAAAGFEQREHFGSFWAFTMNFQKPCYPEVMTVQQILQQALRLKEEERIVVANSLLESIEAPADRRSDEEWVAEIERRARAALAGSPGLTWADARARIEERLDLR